MAWDKRAVASAAVSVWGTLLASGQGDAQGETRTLRILPKAFAFMHIKENVAGGFGR